MSAFRPLRSDRRMPTIGSGGYDSRRCPQSTARTERSLVGRARRHRRGARRVRPLFRLRRARRRELLLRAVFVTALFAMPYDELRPPDLAAHRSVLEPVTGDPDRRFPARVPRDLLLLPALVLPRVLLGAPRVRRARRAKGLCGRDALPVPHPEPAPLRAHL